MENLKVLAPLDQAFTPIYRSLCDFKARAEKENGPVIRIALDAELDTINELTSKIDALPGVGAKTVVSA